LLYNDLIDGAKIFDSLPEIFAILVPSGFVFVFFLYVQGVSKKRDKTNHENENEDIFVSDNFVWDFYKGIQLHPRIFGVDLKQLINCRIAMMSWSLLLLLYLDKQNNQSGGMRGELIVSVVLQLIYVAKFFLWERGYFFSIDIIHDRCGFMIIWGVLCWLPCVYTNHSYYLVDFQPNLNDQFRVFKLISVFLFGLVSIALNYYADYQRQLARDTNGNCSFFGHKAVVIPVEYTVETHDKKEEKKKTLLLCSGMWGLARHFNYVFELMLALSFGLPSFEWSLTCHFYFIFLCILLFDRAGRDDERCAQKYKNHWEEYKKRVPYSIIPYVY